VLSNLKLQASVHSNITANHISAAVTHSNISKTRLFLTKIENLKIFFWRFRRFSCYGVLLDSVWWACYSSWNET